MAPTQKRASKLERPDGGSKRKIAVPELAAQLQCSSSSTFSITSAISSSSSPSSEASSRSSSSSSSASSSGTASSSASTTSASSVSSSVSSSPVPTGSSSFSAGGIGRARRDFRNASGS